MKPIILYSGKHTRSDLADLKSGHNIWQEIDIYDAQLKELFEIYHPEKLGKEHCEDELQDFIDKKNGLPTNKLVGNWIYFPWSGVLLHTLEEEDYFNLRTNRNRNLITQAEQEKLLNFNVALVGLSVGSNIATLLTYNGIAQNMKLAEFDNLETSNLNRIRANLEDITSPKIDILSKQIYNVNPYAQLATFSAGLDDTSLEEFVLSDPKPNLIFEVIDSFEMKIKLRMLAREHRIPVIMVTNLGDRVLIDLERHDIEEHVEFFNGRAGKIPQDILNNPDVTDADKHKYAVDLAGVKNIPQRAMDSVAEIGKTLVGRPQLASSVNMSAAVCVYLAKKIALGDPSLKSGSWLFDLDRMTQEDTFSLI